MNKACSFTGHRYIANNEIDLLKARLKKVIVDLIDEGYNEFISGGAIGFDTLAAETVIELKREFPDIRLSLALPCVTQADKWNYNQKKAYRDILLQADSTVYVSKEYYSGCMHKRNRYLIDNSSVCIAYFNGKPGGTEYTVRYAFENGVKIINLYA